MAAPDFPSSPTIGQTYTAPSGLQYTYDGQVWTSSSTSQSWLWTDTGTALTPYVATRQVSVPGAAPATGFASLILGSNTAKARLQNNNTGASGAPFVSLTTNRDVATNTQDDTSRPSWQLALRSDVDNFGVYRQPAAGALAALLTLDNVGHLTFKAMACNITNNNVAQTITANTWTTVNMTTLGFDSSGGVMPLAASSQIKLPSTGGWVLLVSWLSLTANASASAVIQGSNDGSTGWFTINASSIPSTANQCGVIGTSWSGATQYYRIQVYQSAGGVQYCNLTAIALGGV
jgi:hypothetical protein